jgi:hypothetical protein
MHIMLLQRKFIYRNQFLNANRRNRVFSLNGRSDKARTYLF